MLSPTCWRSRRGCTAACRARAGSTRTPWGAGGGGSSPRRSGRPAAGVLDALEAERSQQEIAWAVREWAEQLAKERPLVLVFEDIHWAEERLLGLIEHLAEWVREAPLLLVCLARTELLDVRPRWGGGRVRATAIELEPLPLEESEELLDALLEQVPLPAVLRPALLEKTEGNPLFLEETIRMIAEADGGSEPDGIPDTLQALIA